MNKVKVKNRIYWLGIGSALILVYIAAICFLGHLVGKAMLLSLVALGLMLLLLIWSIIERETARMSLVLGIIGILLGGVVIIGPTIGLFCSILAIFFGIISLRRKKRMGISWAGIILGAIGIAYFLYIIIASLIEVC